MDMKTNSRFQRGSGVFKCGDCGRATRHTGVQSGDARCCPSCYDLAGLDNARQDNCLTEHDIPAIKDLFAESVLKGGNEIMLRASYPELAELAGF